MKRNSYTYRTKKSKKLILFNLHSHFLDSCTTLEQFGYIRENNTIPNHQNYSYTFYSPLIPSYLHHVNWFLCWSILLIVPTPFAQHALGSRNFWLNRNNISYGTYFGRSNTTPSSRRKDRKQYSP